MDRTRASCFLSDNNLNRLDLSKIAFRMKEWEKAGADGLYEKPSSN